MQGKTERFITTGIDLNRPVDAVKEGRFPYLENMRVTTQGQLEPRLGLTDRGTPVVGQSPVHSIRRLNDPSASTYTNVIGTGTHLAIGPTGGPYNDLDLGYSGSPLALVPYRPETATAAWMYVADSSRMRKVSRAGLLQPIGLALPPTAPSVALSTTLQTKVVNEGNNNADWTQGGDAGAPSNQTRLGTTIAQIVYDSGTTGWATINPTTFSTAIGPGTRITINTGGGTAETVTVEEVHPGAAATTIGSIIYDSGTSGMASVVLAAPVTTAQELNGLIRNTTVGPENTRILAVTEGPDGNVSLRISTTNTWAAGNTVQILGSFRANCANNHAAAEVLDAPFVRTAITYSAANGGVATLTDTITLDLSVFTSIAIRPDDIVHISVRVDRPDRLTELKVMADVDSATNDFTRNFYTKSFRADDLTAALRYATGTGATLVTTGQPTTSALQTAIQRNIIDESVIEDPYTGQPVVTTADPTEPTTPIFTAMNPATSQQMDPGDTQWIELFFPISDWLAGRVGTDDSRTLQNIAATRIAAIVSGNVTLDIAAWHVRGGYGPDVADLGTPYVYRYRARILSTNVTSNFSPASRGGVNARRQQITVTPTQYAAPSGTNLTAATDIVLDIERYGGNLPEWHYVGTTANGASPSFTDTYPDDTAAKLDMLTNDHFQPWPIIQTPASGTTGQVSGTTVNDTAANFNTSWAPGTRIRIANVPYTIYRVISTSRLEIVENAGNQSAVAWEISEPTLLGQPLPCLWGDEEFGAVFACGDSVNPGRLYFSNEHDPDSTTEKKYIDVTAPAEPLQNGLVWNGRSYVYSSERCFQILPTGNPESPYRAEEVPGTGGMFSRWGLTRNPHAPFMATIVKDGININTGGAAQSLTDDDLYPLFPNEGNLGLTINSIVAPNIVSAQAANLRLAFYDNYLYFDYINTSAVYRTLAYNVATGGWFADSYTPTIVCHYGGEGSGVHELLCGGSDGKLYQYAGNLDGATAIPCVIETPSVDQGAARLNKYYEDCILDLNPNGVTVTIIPGINSRATTYAGVTTSAASRSQVVAGFGSASVTGRNVSLRITFSVNSVSRPIFYLWEPRWAPETAPLVARRWSVAPTHFGMPNYKHIGTGKITHVSTADLSLIVTLDGAVQSTLTITNSGGAYAESYFRVPAYKGRLLAFDLSSSADFRVAVQDTWFEIGEWGRGDGAYQRVPVFAES